MNTSKTKTRATRSMLTSTLAATTMLTGGLLMATAGVAHAGPYRGDCHAWIHSDSAFTGGATAVCNDGPTYVQYRVVGLCKNRYTNSSRWVYGSWVRDGASYAGCGMRELPVNAYYVTK